MFSIVTESAPFGVAVVFSLPTPLNAYQGAIRDRIPMGDIGMRLEPVAENLVAPVLLTETDDNTGRMFVIEQSGEVRLIKNGVLAAVPYLDTTSLLIPLGGIIPPFQEPFSDYDERGLLGFAIHPDFTQTGQPGFGKFYTYTSEPDSGAADFTLNLPPGEIFDHQSAVREWTVDPTSDVITGDPTTISRILMKVDQPQFNHDGGHLAFGADNMLYIALGDGGGGGDDEPGHGTEGNGQDLTNVHGTLLRIDPLGTNSTNGQYGVPTGNPFLANPNAVDEIWTYGARNPFRFSFDGNRLIVADVGQSNIEEVNIVSPGDNLGWRLKEGSFFYDNVTNTVSTTPFGQLPPGFNPVDPVLEYDHDDGISIIGGFVYRGSEFPALTGKYIFGDFSNGGFFTPGGRLFYGDLSTGEILEFNLGRPLGLYVKGFGQDASGEIYLMSGTNLGPFRDSNGIGYGLIHKLVDVPAVSLPADLMTVVNGIQTGGSVADLVASDNVDVSIVRDPLGFRGVVVELKAISPVAAPAMFELSLESAGFFRTPVVQTIEFFDYDAGVFVEADSRNSARFRDSVAVAFGSGDLSRYVEDATGCVAARVTFSPEVGKAIFGITIDRFFWGIE